MTDSTAGTRGRLDLSGSEKPPDRSAQVLFALNVFQASPSGVQVLKSATLLTELSSLAQSHPSWGGVRTQEGHQAERRRCRVACSLQTSPRIPPASVQRRAVEPAPPTAGAGAFKGRVRLLPRAGFGCRGPALARVSGRACILFLWTGSPPCASLCSRTVRVRAALSPRG